MSYTGDGEQPGVKLPDFKQDDRPVEEMTENELLGQIRDRLDYLPVIDKKLESVIAIEERLAKKPAAIAEFWRSLTPMNRRVLVYTVVFGVLTALHVSLDEIGGIQGLLRLALLGAEGLP